MEPNLEEESRLSTEGARLALGDVFPGTRENINKRLACGHVCGAHRQSLVSHGRWERSQRGPFRLRIGSLSSQA